MRISDWSSDVCSSDLQAGTGHLAHHLVGEALGERAVEHARQPVLGVLRGTPDQQPRRLDPHRHLGQLHLYRLELDQRLAEGLALLHVAERLVERRLRDGQAHGRVTAALQVRSEEHTSELQSLMRISYAVFCLKKKT